MPFYDRLSAHPMERTGPIAAHWRGRIVRGSLAPGAVFPTRLELTRRHRTTRATIDRVIKNLQAAGFIESRRGAGARVVPHPPHLCTFGLVFRGNPGRTEPHDTQRRTFLDEAFCRAARGLSRPPAVRLTIFQDVPSDDDGGACPALLDAIRGERLAGLILPTPGYWRAR